MKEPRGFFLAVGGEFPMVFEDGEVLVKCTKLERCSDGAYNFTLVRQDNGEEILGSTKPAA